MSCFIVPLVQALATSAYRSHNDRKYSNKQMPYIKSQIPVLEKMLWGGTILLVVDHIFAGELTWTFPFFTALMKEGGAGVMVHEMLTVGVPMSLILTSVWALMSIGSLMRKAKRKLS